MSDHYKFEDLDVIKIVAEKLQISKQVAGKLSRLIEVEECTIPFIARYRKEQTNNMDAEKLRMFYNALKEIRDVQKKADVMVKKIEKQGQLNDQIHKSLKCAHSIDELNHLFAPYKGDQKHSLADRARSLGLEDAALTLLHQPQVTTNLRNWVKKGEDGLATLSEVERGVKHLIADHIAKHKDTMDAIRKIFQVGSFTLQSKLSASKIKELKQPESSKSSKVFSQADNTAPVRNDRSKYTIYYNFQCLVSHLKSFQILAINRGEAQKQLTVKLLINERMENDFLQWCQQRWSNPIVSEEHRVLVEICIDDSYKRLIKPLVVRRTRSDLTRSAHLASVEVFRRNLKKLLLTAPVRDKTVLGVDPGFKNGCKCAIISPTGSSVLATFVFNLNDRKSAIEKAMPDYTQARLWLTSAMACGRKICSKRILFEIKKLYKEHPFNVVAIGNGTGCRETEQFVSGFIRDQQGSDIVYCIVNENGASIYSVTEDAKAEFPDLDPNLRSAVSIARRLQDPLVELVKIEPKHIGVGMYQHDIPDALLKASLNDVVEDCVTFVGVDLNVASAALLKRVAGLKSAQVEKILKWREKNGRFVNRQQLLSVPGIGNKTFEQCAGFVRITPTAGGISLSSCVKDECSDKEDEKLIGKKRKRTVTKSSKAKKAKLSVQNVDYLDQTWIHPESYEVTRKFLSSIGCKDSDIGKPSFIFQIKEAKAHLEMYVEQLEIGRPTLELIIEGLAQPTGYRDIRKESAKPLYRRGVRSLLDLRRNDVLQGRVTNVTDFGIFVDVGVGQDGLAHFSKISRWDQVKETIGPNDCITVSVIDMSKKLSLKMISYESKSTVLL